MKSRNPMHNPEIVARMKASLQGRTFLARGGNPKITEPQQLLANRLELLTEFPIKTRPVRAMFECLPHCYKVDLASPNHKLAIEVDGNTHKLKKWRFLDSRKTAVLNALGWTVLRFWNSEVLEESDRVVAAILRSMSELQPHPR